MKNLLIVEDNRISGTLIRAKVSSVLDFNIHWAKSLAETIELLNTHNNNFFAALLDYVLPDAPDGQVIDEVVSRGISSIVFTATMTEKVRKDLWKKNIVDYVIKDDTQSIEYLTFLLSRLEKNQHIKVLVADDSRFFRVVLTKLLKVQNYQVLEAVDGEDALKIVESNPDIQLVITDYMMPNMDGFTLTKRLRKKYGREGIVILGVTSDRDKTMGAQFIKCGANDFIEKKSFIAEELYCRVNQNLENLESIQTIRKMATTDFLTGLYNRRHFYELATKLCASASRSKHDIACAMIDADHFKMINDNYGHAIGDKVLKHLAVILGQYFQRSSDLVGRMGGEEFCVLADNVKPQDAVTLFEELCRRVENTPFPLPEGGELKITVSMGVCTLVGEGLDQMLKKADELLYGAKHGGRNRVVVDTMTTA
ncbi:MAG TPA: diguanylate cyclase [Gammaproteobacteria bacterium]|nr:diguanylate cyclase [Gammaproteobacteria bacterium]